MRDDGSLSYSYKAKGERREKWVDSTDEEAIN